MTTKDYERKRDFSRTSEPLCAKKRRGGKPVFVIAKRADSPYRHGRSRDWLKFKCAKGQKLVGEFGFTEWTRDGKLRHPRFLGLRRDKPARDVVRERVER